MALLANPSTIGGMLGYPTGSSTGSTSTSTTQPKTGINPATGLPYTSTTPTTQSTPSQPSIPPMPPQPSTGGATGLSLPGGGSITPPAPQQPTQQPTSIQPPAPQSQPTQKPTSIQPPAPQQPAAQTLPVAQPAAGSAFTPVASPLSGGAGTITQANITPQQPTSIQPPAPQANQPQSQPATQPPSNSGLPTLPGLPGGSTPGTGTGILPGLPGLPGQPSTPSTPSNPGVTPLPGGMTNGTITDQNVPGTFQPYGGPGVGSPNSPGTITSGQVVNTPGYPLPPTPNQDLGATLQNAYNNAPQAQPLQSFNFNGQQVQVPQFTPGANPFQIQNNLAPFQSQLSGPQQTTSGQQFQAPQSPLQSSLTGMLTGALQNPNPYTTPAAQAATQSEINALNTQFAASRQAINDNANQHGTFFSTIPQGQLGDLGVQQANQMQQFESNLLQNTVNAQAQGLQTAGNLGLGAQQQGFNQALSGFGANLGAQQQQFGQNLAGQQFQQGEQSSLLANLLSATGFNQNLAQQNFANQLSSGQFNLGQQQQQFGQQLGQSQQNQALQGQTFGQGQATLGNLVNFGQQGFQNQLATATFNQSQDQLNNALLLNLLGAA